jgi:hypothetical protein
MINIENDLRYPHMSEFARSELAVYLQWINDAQIDDTEYSFVAYILGRCSLIDARHLFKIWEYQAGNNSDKATKRLMRRFFINPSPAINFKQPSVAGWFDFIGSVHEMKAKINYTPIIEPLFSKVGFNELPTQHNSIGYLNNES